MLGTKPSKKLETTCHTDDEEADHANADNIICELLVDLGCSEVVRAWKKVKNITHKGIILWRKEENVKTV